MSGRNSSVRSAARQWEEMLRHEVREIDSAVVVRITVRSDNADDVGWWREIAGSHQRSMHGHTEVRAPKHNDM